MSKKALSLLLAVLLVAAALVSGCSNDKGTVIESEVVPETTVNADGQEVVVAEKPSGKIVVWGWDAVKSTLELNLEAFYAEYPDIEVEFQVAGNTDIYQKLLLGLSAGGEGLPDVITVETANLAQFVEFGGLMDLTDRVEPYMEVINDFKWADATSSDGKIYAMPWDSGPVALYYRADIFEAAGLPSEPAEVQELLKTWDDYYEAAKIIKEETGSYMFSQSQETPSGRNFEKLLWQQGQFYFDADGNPQLDSPESIAAMELLMKFINEDLADNTAEWTQPYYDNVANGTIATMFSASWMGGFLESWIAPDTAGLWRVVPLPTWPGSTNVSSNDGGSNLVIPDTSENKEAAWAFVEFMLGREDSQLEIYKAFDIFPSLETTYSDEFFDEPLAFYGNQAARRVFADTVADIPKLEYTQYYTIANEALLEAYAKIIYNGVDIETALQEANEKVKLNIE